MSEEMHFMAGGDKHAACGLVDPWLYTDMDESVSCPECVYIRVGHYPGCGVGEGMQFMRCDCKDRFRRENEID